MSKDNAKSGGYASLRIRVSTNKKLKVLSGLSGETSIDIVDRLVENEYRIALIDEVENIGLEFEVEVVED